jgi:cobalt-zinc-cadmium efflux system outer membrane protein
MSTKVGKQRLLPRDSEIPQAVKAPHNFCVGRIVGHAGLLAALFISGGASTVRAQRLDNANLNKITLEQALDLAEKYNPQLRAAMELTSVASAAVTTAKAYPNPQFNFLMGPQYGRLRFMPPGPAGLLQHYSADQTIELPAIRKTRIEFAESGLDIGDLNLAETRRLVRGAVKQAFFESLRRRGEMELTQETLRLIEDLRRRVEVQVRVGEAARLELTRAEAEVATARTLARSAQLRYLNAISALRASIAAPLTVDIDPQGQLQSPGPLPSLEVLTQEVLTRHPALAQAEAEVRRAEARLASEKAQRLPVPSLRAEWENQPDLGFYRFGISLPLPLWNRRQGPIAESEAAVRQAKALSEARRLEISAALERAYRLYEVASSQVTSFQEGVLKEAEAAVQAAEAAFRFGERGIIEVLDAQRVLRSVRLDYLNARFDQQSALVELEQLRALEITLPRRQP